MKNLSFIISILILGACSTNKNVESVNEIIDSLMICNTSVEINYYENDSLNKARHYVIPIMYFHFKAINQSNDTFNLVLNRDQPVMYPKKLYVAFEYNSIIDTLVLSDFANFNVFKLIPHDTTRFMVQGFIPTLLDKNTFENISAKELMHKIAQTGKIYYTPMLEDTSKIVAGKLLDSMQIRRIKPYEIVFRDPEDTAIE